MVLALAMMFIGMGASSILTPVLQPLTRPLGHATEQALQNQILDPATAITLKRRKIIPEEQFIDTLQKAGFNNEISQLLFKSTEFFPQVQDGIRFAVREAFREDIATLFELDTNFDKLPLEFFEKMGLDKEVLRLFWRSHWELPAPAQGFEMFQRLSDLQLPHKQDTIKRLGLTASEVVTNEFELNTLLTSLDIMPPWQKRLTMIAYQPITRVDIRRFVEKGILPIEDAEFRYREIGNSPEDAKLQVKFIRAEMILDEVIPLLKAGEITPDAATDRINEVIENPTRAKEIVSNLMIGAKKTRTKKEKDLTRSQLENAFEDGLITEENFLAAMQTQGLDIDESNIVLQLLKNKIAERELRQLEKEKKITKTEIIRSYINGTLNRLEAANKLDELRFNDADIELMLLNAEVKINANKQREAEKEQRAKERAIKEQTKTDTLKALRKGVLTESQAIEELKEATYSDDAISIIIATERATQQEKESA